MKTLIFSLLIVLLNLYIAAADIPDHSAHTTKKKANVADSNKSADKKNMQIKNFEVNSDTSGQIANDTCPVLGGAVDKKLFVEKNGKKIYVCCESCLKTVKKDFDKYYNKAYKKVETKKTQAIVYTCTMHPEVISDKPGKCPKCGMTLVVKK